MSVRWPANRSRLKVAATTIVSRGLVGNERQEIQDMREYLTQTIKVAEEGRRINRRLGETGEVWDQIIADCEENRDEAQQLLDRR